MVSDSEASTPGVLTDNEICDAIPREIATPSTTPDRTSDDQKVKMPPSRAQVTSALGNIGTALPTRDTQRADYQAFVPIETLLRVPDRASCANIDPEVLLTTALLIPPFIKWFCIAI